MNQTLLHKLLCLRCKYPLAHARVSGYELCPECGLRQDRIAAIAWRRRRTVLLSYTCLTLALPAIVTCPYWDWLAWLNHDDLPACCLVITLFCISVTFFSSVVLARKYVMKVLPVYPRSVPIMSVCVLPLSVGISMFFIFLHVVADC
jgi:hypothetical protein